MVTAALGTMLYSDSGMLGDPDTHLHLAAGYWILQHQSVPLTDLFSYTRLGAPWVPHEWLAQCLLALTHQGTGWAGLVVLTGLSFALTLAILLRFLLPRVPPAYAVFFTIMAAFPLYTHLLARPHVLAWPLLTFWCGQLLHATEQVRRPAWWLAGVMALWANLHGSFTLGLVLLMPFALEAVINSPRAQRRATLGAWCLFLGLSLLAALLTPAGWRGIWLTSHLMHLQQLNSISEWMPATGSPLLALELSLLPLLGLALLGFVRLPLVRLLLLLALLSQALQHARHISVFGLLMPMLLAAPFGMQYRLRPTGEAPADGLDRFFESLSAPARPLAMGVAAGVILVVAVVVAQSGRHQPPARNMPIAAVDAALASGARGRVLNTDNFGGYLMSRRIPVFIDGRADLYGDAFIADYLDTVSSNKVERIAATLNRHAIGWTLVPPDSVLLLYLDSQADWKRIHTDTTAVVHVRKPVP